MNKRELKQLDRELSAFLDSMTNGMGRPERRAAMRDYVTGLLLDGERKSIEPMASRLVDDDSGVQAMRQRLQQCVTVSPWSDEELMKRLALKVNAEMPCVEARTPTSREWRHRWSHPRAGESATRRRR